MRKERPERKKTPELEAPACDASLALPVIAIVGRPNVGKSSLFNAILRRRQAIVHFDAGVTRDRVTAAGVFDGRRFNLIDTGGLGMFSGEKRKVGFWDRSIEEQVEAAVESALTILFVVDVSTGLSPLDESIAARLRASGKRIILVCNKADNHEAEQGTLEFHSLGFDRVHAVSCLHRIGIDSLMLDALEGVAPNTAAGDAENAPRPLRIAVLGRPNVGKSSIVNRVLGEDRVIVSDVAGTTRDAVDIQFTLRCGDEDVSAVLVDTAGLRKRSKIDGAVERYSMMRAEEALEQCDIVLFVIEAQIGSSTAQDKTISRMIIESGKGCVIVANKWDACEGKKKELIEGLRESLPKMFYAPMVPVSAKTGYNFRELFEAIAELRAQMSVKISTSVLNKVVSDAQKKNLPPVVNAGKLFRIYYGTMVGNCPPCFSLFVNDPKLCAENYKVYLENYFRKAFAFTGFPIRLYFKARRREELSEILQRKEKFKRDRDKAKRAKSFKPARPEEDLEDDF
ncbi:MAG: ribosome biogenesis GTPase Der [Lentisphaeria bacterium]|nr:ribosome biogenesis GTPase Der [Lentisphaeria bacterium]